MGLQERSGSEACFSLFLLFEKVETNELIIQIHLSKQIGKTTHIKAFTCHLLLSSGKCPAPVTADPGALKGEDAK